MHSSHGQWLMEIFQICVGNVVDGVTTATTAGNCWSFSLWFQTASLRRRHPRVCVRPSIINKIYTLRNTMTREMLKCPSFAIYKAWVWLVRDLGIRSWMSCLLVCLIRASFVCLLQVCYTCQSVTCEILWVKIVTIQEDHNFCKIFSWHRYRKRNSSLKSCVLTVFVEINHWQNLDNYCQFLEYFLCLRLDKKTGDIQLGWC